jgi:sigma-B regulation protein RsbU (phosphoserine phosphatase)
MVYVNSGHNPPILYDKKHGIRLLEEGSTVLGAMHPLPFLNEGFITDLSEFFLFCYTDGVTETLNEAGVEFGFQALLDYFGEERNHLKSLNTIHQDIIVALDTFKGKNGYHDDITMLSCRVG